MKGGKKIVILLSVVLGLLLIIGFFYYWQFYETPVEDWDKAEYSKSEDYIVSQTSEGKIVENKKAGIKFSVPDGWEVEKEEYQDYIVIDSPDIEQSSFLVKNGCKIKVDKRYIKTKLETIENILRKAHVSWGNMDSYEKIILDKHKALRNVAGISKLDQHYIAIYVPINNIFKPSVCSVSLNSNVKDKEECSKIFDEFLGKISIK